MVNKHNPHIGIIGGGQLAKMTAAAARRLGCAVSLLERNSNAVALGLADEYLIGDWDDPHSLIKLAGNTDIVTLENEFVDAGSLAQIEAAGYRLFPTAASIGMIQDKLIQKKTLQQAGLPLPPFQEVGSHRHIIAAAAEFGWPLVLKTRRNGYDGKGNATITKKQEIDAAWAKLEGDKNSLYVEAHCPFTAELAVIITTGRRGEQAIYPVVESVQKNHVCHTVRAPAPVSAEIAAGAADIARQALSTVGAIGSFGVEMFLLKNNKIMINELAPRVHNSGHYTIEACACSQFENHLRAILGWPLGSTRMIKPAAVMINLLGQTHGDAAISGLDKALGTEDAKIYIYGKESVTPGRKMGHVTALGETLPAAEQAATKAHSAIYFGTD